MAPGPSGWVRFASIVLIYAGIIGGLSGAVWLPYYPVWSLVYVGISVLVVYALIAHFEPARTTEPQQDIPTA